MLQLHVQFVRDFVWQIVQQFSPHCLLYYVLACVIAVHVFLIAPVSRLGRVEQISLQSANNGRRILQRFKII
ncbi:hypothetical protein X777_06021 [Ooceraea biroi]|uniref:Uncharacterized protein n=1 Tax=Ooceraea biroi TaxID=2015173 RepID=A0A026WET9_OOCBI|nr:hypothetical protein X777_06021 [Ooceraea biroi]